MKILIKDILVALYNDNKYVVQDANIFIEDDKIIGINDSPQDFKPDKVIDGNNKLLLPGLINAHTHSYMTLFRNYADDLPFKEWLFDNILPLEDKLSGEDAYWGSMLGIIEMLKTGTTCFTDMYMFIHETAKAVEESGIRACLSRGLVGKDNNAGGIRRINEAKEEIDYWTKKGTNRLSFMLAPHAPYSCDSQYLRKVIDEAKALEVGLNIHLSESKNEVDEIRSLYNCSPVEYLYKLGFFEIKTLAAHCVHMSDSDIEILANNCVNVVTNPVSNLKLGNGIAPIAKMISNNINVCMGTDGAASNNSLNLFKELHFVTLIHKGIQEDAELISASTGLEFITINGAKALGLDRIIGKIEVGMKADLIILDIDRPQFYPRNNLISALAYSSTGEEVETVIVDGKILIEKNEYKTIDVEKVIYKAKEISAKLQL